MTPLHLFGFGKKKWNIISRISFYFSLAILKILSVSFYGIRHRKTVFIIPVIEHTFVCRSSRKAAESRRSHAPLKRVDNWKILLPVSYQSIKTFWWLFKAVAYFLFTYSAIAFSTSILNRSHTSVKRNFRTFEVLDETN